MKPQDDKAFIGAEATIVNRAATGLEGSSASTRQTSSSTASSARKSIITISAYDARQGGRGPNHPPPATKRITSDHGIAVNLNVKRDPQRTSSVVQIGCFAPNTSSPKKLSFDQLKSFQGQKRPQTTANRSVTFISGSPELVPTLSASQISTPKTVQVPKMMTIMSSTSIPLDSSSASSPNSSSKNSEMDTFALDSGTCSDLEINSSSSSLNNSITPPPLPKKMNKTKEKLKSENEKFFHLKNYHRQPSMAGVQQQPLHLNDQDDNMSVLSCGSNNSSNCSSFSLISCDSLNAANRRLTTRSLLPHSPTTTTTSYSSSDSPTPSSVGDPPVIVSDPDKQNAIVLSVKANPVENHRYMSKKNLLPTSLLADIRSTKRTSSGGVTGGHNGPNSLQQQKKNVNVISIRAPSTADEEEEEDDNGTTIEFHNNNKSSKTTVHNGVGGVGGEGAVTSESSVEPEKYLTKKFINFSIHSMLDNEGEEDDDDDKMDKGYFEGGLSPRRSELKSAFASMDSRKSIQFENDSFYNFHINENNLSYLLNKSDKSIYDTNEDSFAGYRDLTTAYSPMSGSSTIRSNKGTIRGVKNRVRNGIATFLQMQHANIKVSQKNMEKK